MIFVESFWKAMVPPPKLLMYRSHLFDFSVLTDVFIAKQEKHIDFFTLTVPIIFYKNLRPDFY